MGGGGVGVAVFQLVLSACYEMGKRRQLVTSHRFRNPKPLPSESKAGGLQRAAVIISLTSSLRSVKLTQEQPTGPWNILSTPHGAFRLQVYKKQLQLVSSLVILFFGS